MIARTLQEESRLSGQAHNPVVAVAVRAADVAGDFVELVELQTRLTKANSKELVNLAIPAILTVVLAAMLGVSATCVLLMAGAAAFSELLQWPAWLSNLTVGLGGLLIAMTFVAVGLGRLRRSLSSLDSSLTQLSHNFAWLKGVIRGE